MERYAGLFVIQDRHILLVQEKKHRAYGQWSLPAGEVELGETDEQAALREGQEETGYSFRIRRLLEEREHTNPDFVYSVFDGEIIGGDLIVRSTEHLAVAWVDIDQIDMLQFRPSNAFVKEYVRKYTVDI